MPLYRRSVKKPFLSQDAPGTKKIFSEFKRPSSSQTAVDNLLGSHGEMKSLIYPEVFPRTASEPALSDDKFGKTELNLKNDRTCDKFESDDNSQTALANISLNYSGSSQLSLNDPPVKEAFKKFMLKKKMEEENCISSQNSDISLNDSVVRNANTQFISENEPEGNVFSTSQYKDLDSSLNSSRSSQVSLNSPHVKEAYKKFMLQKKVEVDENCISSPNSEISLNDPIVRSAYSQFLSKKEKFARVNTPKGLTHYDKMKWLQEQRNVGVYVHCDKCDKIRYLDEIKDPTLLPDKWYCENNTDIKYNTCEAPEEKFPLHIQEDWIDNLYNAGSIVWAKVDGFPWWPGMVDDDPDTESYYLLDDEISNSPCYYHVTFFDQVVSREWLKPSKIKSFHKEVGNLNVLPKKCRKFKKRFDLAMQQARKALRMPLHERLESFSFLTRYKKPIKEPRNVTEKSKRKLPKLNKNDLAKEKRGDRIKEKKKQRINKGHKLKSCDSFFDDFEMTPSATLDEISLELFENV